MVRTIYAHTEYAAGPAEAAINSAPVNGAAKPEGERPKLSEPDCQPGRPVQPTRWQRYGPRKSDVLPMIWGAFAVIGIAEISIRILKAIFAS